MPSSSEIYDPLTLEFKERTKLQKFSCYYPQQRVVNKFYENNCDSLAVKLWRTAYHDCDHEEVIRRLFDEKQGALQMHLRATPHLDDADTAFNPEYTYRRCETLLRLIKNAESDNQD